MDIARQLLHSSTAAFDRFLTFCYVATGLMVLAMAMFFGYEVLMRYAFDKPTFWVIQASEYILVYITFLVAAPLLRDGGHTKMTIVIERLGARRSRYLDAFTSTVGLAVCIIFSWQTTARVLDAIDRGVVYRDGFHLHQAVVWWVMPLAFILMSIQFIRLFMEQAYNIKNDIVPGGEKATHGMA